MKCFVLVVSMDAVFWRYFCSYFDVPVTPLDPSQLQAYIA